jgi:hypothetical protein
MNHPFCQHYWCITLPKIGFPRPKFTFGQVVHHPNTGLWGNVIGMNYISPDLYPGWPPGWSYQIRLSVVCCSEDDYELMSGQETFSEGQLEGK